MAPEVETAGLRRRSSGGTGPTDSRIDPSNAFRVVVKCEKYNAILDYEKFMEDMAAKTIWGCGQKLVVWGVDSDFGSEWKLTSNDEFMDLLHSRWAERLANMCVQVVEKDGHQDVGTTSSNAAAASGVLGFGVTDAVEGGGGGGVGDTCTSPDAAYGNVDWSTLTVIPEEANDDDMLALADEDKVFEAMGFKEADEKAAEEAAKEKKKLATKVKKASPAKKKK
ncbi:hypothetical protein C2845_PM16G20390 [Panicum miliaceum]|uniref:Uncharacterized protein n=1 Tax=Panicum miliaceum TaxID=4540 RepID=A0A3L6PXB1_PANMI|nr:hypothetical protein C2845_PM16G20390 [Panicum miliaceum]